MNPKLIRNIIYPAYWFFRRDHVYQKLKELERNQWLSKRELQNMQWKKLKRLLDYVYINVPYYTQLFNDLGLKPKIIQDPADLLEIPILTKDIIRNNMKKMISIDPTRKGTAANTGGSTGETLYFFKDLTSLGYHKANLIRLNKWCGADIGDREAALWGTHFDTSWTANMADKVRKSLKNFLYLSTFDLSEKNMLRYAKILYKFKPVLLRGYPSALYTFANFLKKNNITSVKPKAIISTGEKAFHFQKQLMKEVFSTEIYERYGSNEFGNIAHECAIHNGLHLINDMYYVELFNSGNNNTPGQMGEAKEIIVTDLYNYYMPFLRYKIGDLGVISDAQCECGREFPVFEDIVGRSFDVTKTPSGKMLGGYFWTYLSRAVPGIKQFQVVQKHKDSVELKIVTDHDFKMESIKHLESQIKEKGDPKLKVNIKIVDKIPLTPSGKFRFIISEA